MFSGAVPGGGPGPNPPVLLQPAVVFVCQLKNAPKKISLYFLLWSAAFGGFDRGFVRL